VEPRAAVWLLGVAGVFFGLSTPMLFSVGATLAGPRAAGRWAGAQNLAGQLAGIVAPVVTGFIVDSTGAFSWAFAVASVSAVLAMVAWGIVIRQVAPVPWPEVLTPAPVTPASAPAGAA
jgi:MFS family permease